MTNVFQWQSIQQHPGVFVHFAQRESWQVGAIEQFDNEFRMRPGFPFPSGFSEFLYPAGVPDVLTVAKAHFESAFTQFLSNAGCRLTQPTLRLTWREDGGRHYGLARSLLIFIVHEHDGIWALDNLLPFTNIKIDGDEWSGKHDLHEFDATDPKFVRNIPYGKAENTADYVKNQAEILLFGWLARSAFMMRWEEGSLPVGQQT